jgi:folate-binding protein YgfZ
MPLATLETDVASQEAAIEAAASKAVVVDRSDLGMLKFSGATRLDLINRMSTQKVDSLQSGQGAATVLTTDIGRIIDRLILYVASDTVYCLTGENNSDHIAAYLKRFVFFMDDFQVEDLSAETAIIAIYGRHADLALAEIFGETPELALHHWRQLDLKGRTVYLHRTDPLAGDGYFIMGQMADKEPLWQEITGKGPVAIDEAAFDYLRIQSGQPRFGRELTDEYIPLEANLWADVSFNKGCYTGQEIIARMESRGRLAKKLARLLPDAPITVGAELSAGGKKAGRVTSAATGPAGPVALGYVKTAFLDKNTTLTAGQTRVEIESL